MPTVPRDWAEPFLKQARADLHAARTLLGSDECASTFCMLLQMVYEKLAKAAYARAGTFPPRSHKAASHLFVLLQRHPAGKQLLTASPNVQQFIAELENAHPAVADRQTPPWPQLEYPWEDAETESVMYPEANLYLVRRVLNPKDRIAVDLLKFATALEQQLEAIVP